MPDDIKLPEPVAWRYVPSAVWRGYAYTDLQAMAADAEALGCNPEPLYTADQVRAAARALEVENHALRQQVAALSREAYTWSKALEAALAQREPLTDEQIVACLIESSCVGTVKMSYDVGPYEVTKQSLNATRLTRAIERAHGIPAPKGGSDA